MLVLPFTTKPKVPSKKREAIIAFLIRVYLCSFLVKISLTESFRLRMTLTKDP